MIFGKGSAALAIEQGAPLRTGMARITGAADANGCAANRVAIERPQGRIALDAENNGAELPIVAELHAAE